jgi:uncharacterized RDD family membrane protein YckC
MSARELRFNSSASILFWVWGILVLLIGFAVGYPALMMHGSVMPLFLFGLWGAAFCFGGYSLRRRLYGVRWWGLAICVLSVIALIFAHAQISLIGILINVTAIGLIIASWNVHTNKEKQPT